MVNRLLIILGYSLLGASFLILGACAVINQPRFGDLPRGERLARIEHSANYRDGKFHNQIPTPKFSQDAGLFSILWSGLFDKVENLVPAAPLPAVKTDLFAVAASGQDTVVWMGHSSWFIRAGGKTILIDPVLSPYGAPFSFMNKAFPGTTIYTADDIPDVDCLIISHDHWDHLDYSTVTALKSKIKEVICPLGVGAYFESWGYPGDRIREGDWGDAFALGDDVLVHVLPARHYTGRLFKENKTFWASFAIITPERKIFYSGDTGYGPHFSKIGKAFGGFDMALLDCGQYDPRWAYIHMNPEEAAKAAQELGAKALLPSHVGRFALARHPWNEPFKRLAKADQDSAFGLITPEIGAPVPVTGNIPELSLWWE